MRRSLRGGGDGCVEHTALGTSAQHRVTRANPASPPVPLRWRRLVRAVAEIRPTPMQPAAEPQDHHGTAPFVGTSNTYIRRYTATHHDVQDPLWQDGAETLLALRRADGLPLPPTATE